MYSHWHPHPLSVGGALYDISYKSYPQNVLAHSFPPKYQDYSKHVNYYAVYCVLHLNIVTEGKLSMLHLSFLVLLLFCSQRIDLKTALIERKIWKVDSVIKRQGREGLKIPKRDKRRENQESTVL